MSIRLSPRTLTRLVIGAAVGAIALSMGLPRSLKRVPEPAIQVSAYAALPHIAPPPQTPSSRVPRADLQPYYVHASLVP